MADGWAYYKRYPRDFIRATQGLNLEEKGGYSIVLDLIYANDGELVDDSRYIAGVLGCSVRKWNAIRAKLIAQGGLYVNAGTLQSRLAEAWSRLKGRRQLSASVRAAIFDRDGHECRYCGDTEGPFEIDHVHPVALGGGDEESNLTVACASCNRSKGPKTLEEWLRD